MGSGGVKKSCILNLQAFEFFTPIWSFFCISKRFIMRIEVYILNNLLGQIHVFS